MAKFFQLKKTNPSFSTSPVSPFTQEETKHLIRVIQTLRPNINYHDAEVLLRHPDDGGSLVQPLRSKTPIATDENVHLFADRLAQRLSTDYAVNLNGNNVYLSLNKVTAENNFLILSKRYAPRISDVAKPLAKQLQTDYQVNISEEKMKNAIASCVAILHRSASAYALDSILALTQYQQTLLYAGVIFDSSSDAVNVVIYGFTGECLLKPTPINSKELWKKIKKIRSYGSDIAWLKIDIDAADGERAIEQGFSQIRELVARSPYIKNRILFSYTNCEINDAHQKIKLSSSAQGYGSSSNHDFLEESSAMAIVIEVPGYPYLPIDVGYRVGEKTAMPLIENNIKMRRTPPLPLKRINILNGLMDTDEQILFSLLDVAMKFDFDFIKSTFGGEDAVVRPYFVVRNGNVWSEISPQESAGESSIYMKCAPGDVLPDGDFFVATNDLHSPRSVKTLQRYTSKTSVAKRINDFSELINSAIQK